MNKLSASALVFAALLPAGFAAEKKKDTPDHAKVEEMTRLQIFLDKANFGPGKIDGRGGEFTDKALQFYKQTQGGPAPAGAAAAAEETPRKKKEGDKAQLDTSGIDLQSVGEPFTTYTVTKEDVESVGEVPKEPAAQAEKKSLPYQTVLEEVAERYHSDVDFIKELNPKLDVSKLKEGDVVTVPNVEPFDLAAVKQIKPGEDLQGDSAANDVGDDEKSDAKDQEKGDKKDKKDKQETASAEKPKVALTVDTKEKLLEVREGDKLIATFPVTPGSSSIPSPIGEWKIKAIAKMPNFRYDKKMLNEGERSSNAHLLPPGPNNPVGVMWIALNKKGIGIHGTDEPDTIGRAASHGCIRLANWDVVKLAKMVTPGVPVTVK